MGLFRKLGPGSPEKRAPVSAKVAIAEAQQDGTDTATFHGACLGCLFRKGNAVGMGLLRCMGCAYFSFDSDLPNLRLSEATQQELAAHAHGCDDGEIWF